MVKEHTITRNQRFSVVDKCVDECESLVLKESFFSDQEEGVDGAKETVSVDAWRKDTHGKTIWRLSAAGSAGKVLDDFYEVTWFGCCGDWNEKTYFSLHTGKKVFSSSTDDEDALLKIDVPRTRTKRYVTFHYKTEGNWLGQIQFGNSESVLQTVSILKARLDRPPTVMLRMPGKLDAKMATLWPHNDDKSSEAVSVVLVFDWSEQQQEVVIPIENDRLAVQKAKLPRGFSLKM